MRTVDIQALDPANGLPHHISIVKIKDSKVRTPWVFRCTCGRRNYETSWSRAVKFACQHLRRYSR